MRARVCATITLLIVALAIPAAPAAGATPTCDGKTATIVGKSGASMRGTDGADVIVSNGANFVAGLAGNDRICMTGTPPDDYIAVNAGYGHDRVFIRMAVSRSVTAELGPGNDLYIGGPGPDRVIAGAATTGDRIGTGAGADHVAVGAAATPTVDIVRLGRGNDHLEVMGRPAKDAVFEGNGGRDALSMTRMGSFPEGRFDLDNKDEVARVSGQVVVRWDSFQDFSALSHSGGVYFSGSHRPEKISSHSLTGASMGGGDDAMHLGSPPVRGVLRGGAGRDLIRTGGWAFVTGDVDAGRIDMASQGGFGTGDDAGPEMAFTDVEDLTLIGGTVRLMGDSGPNRLDGFGCDVEIYGYGGGDTLSTTWVEDITDECVEEIKMFGGDGDDRMTGERASDKLYGGRGNDIADGRGGIDLCRAEQRTNCELE